MLDDPRRLAVADLTARLSAGLARQSRGYEAAAARSGGPLRQVLDGLGRAKHTQVADLAPLARAFGVPTPTAPSEIPAESSPDWGVILGEAYQGERALEGTARELAGLATDTAVRALALRLVTGTGRDGGEVRKLYLRYS